jgi:hypothetical protein
MINSKFKCGDKVWFTNVGKPISRYVYQVNEVGNTIWYVLTPDPSYMTTIPFYVDENNLYRTQMELTKKV